MVWTTWNKKWLIHTIRAEKNCHDKHWLYIISDIHIFLIKQYFINQQ